jgi:hypothetical protein
VDEPQDSTGARRYLTETERGVRAAVLGALLGVVLAVLGRRR